MKPFCVERVDIPAEFHLFLSPEKKSACGKFLGRFQFPTFQHSNKPVFTGLIEILKGISCWKVLETHFTFQQLPTLSNTLSNAFFIITLFYPIN
jgi:hypothetical protein